jgi:hypothetical protein
MTFVQFGIGFRMTFVHFGAGPSSSFRLCRAGKLRMIEKKNKLFYNCIDTIAAIARTRAVFIAITQ